MRAGTHDTFPARFLNVFVDYPLGQMRVGDKLWMNWNKAPLKLWQTQLNYAVFCASSACGGQLDTSKLYQASNDWVRLSISRVLSREKNVEKITGSSATQNQL